MSEIDGNEKCLTVGKVKKFLADNPDLKDDVILYYPYHYKGYGLIPVGEMDRGKVPEHRGDEPDTDVVVLDWETTLHDDSCFIGKKKEG